MQDANKSYSNILDRMNKKFHEIELIENRDLIPLTKAKQRLFAAMEETESNPLIRVPFAALDALICGLQPGELWLLAARPGMGKTAFALQTAAMVSLEAPVLFFSLEMNAVALAQRLAVAATGIPPRAFRNKDLSLSQKDHLRAFAELSEENLHIDERPSLTPAAIVGAVHRWVALNRKTPALVVIDHIGLVQGCGDGPNANAVLGDVSMAFRNEIAKEFGCAVLLLSQLNRGLESRTDKRPVMSDLRSSGALEQNADGVIGLYRDEYYNKQTTMLQTLEAIILKNRDGECGTAKLHFDRGQISNVNETWRSHPSSGPSQP
jgi:replicative DNA helicase